MTNSRSREAAQRFADRRKREDDAPRLSSEIPKLATLRLAVEERRATVTAAESKHLRHVIVNRAPALFIIPCGDPSCDGGATTDDPIMRELRAHRTASRSTTSASATRTSRCGRNVHAVGTATYRS